MRNITREEVVKITCYEEPEEVPEETLLDFYVLDKFECSKCGEDIALRQWAKSHDARAECLNPECNNKAIMR